MQFISLVIILTLHGANCKPLEVENSPNSANFSQIFFETLNQIVEEIISSQDLQNYVAEYEKLDQNQRNINQISRLKRQATLPNSPFNFLGTTPGNNRPNGFSFFETMAQTVNRVDQMRCIPRTVCEMTANRGIGNFTLPLPTSASVTTDQSSNPFSLSNPSTLRSILGVMQLFRLNQFAAYPYVEAALWGTSHGDASRCKSQFSRCPESSTEGLINQLNSAPGGLQGIVSNVTTSLRPQVPSDSSSATASGLPISPVVAESPQTAGGFFDPFGNFFPLNPAGSSGSTASSTSSSSSGQKPATSPSVAAAPSQFPQVPGGFFDPFGNFFPFSSGGSFPRPDSSAGGSGASSSATQNNFNPSGFQNPAAFGFPPPFPFAPAPGFGNPQPQFDPFFSFPQAQFNPNPSFPAQVPAAVPPSNFLTRRHVSNSNINQKSNTNGDRWKW